MTWVFSLPPAIDTSRYIHNTVIDRMYNKYEFVIRIVQDQELWRSNTKELEDWCFQNSCYYMSDRAWYDPFRQRWESNGIGGGDYFFILTNNKEVATLAQLRWG